MGYVGIGNVNTWHFQNFKYSSVEYDCPNIAIWCTQAKGKPPVGGVSIFGGVIDELMDGTTSTAPESSSITAAPAIALTKPVTSTVSLNNLKPRSNYYFGPFTNDV